MNFDHYDTLLKRWLSSFISHPEALRVRAERSNGVVYVTLQGHKNDQSRLVGGKAKMVSSINALLQAAARKHGEKINFELLEPHTGIKEAEAPYHDDDNWTPEKETDLCNLLKNILSDVIQYGWALETERTPDRTTYTLRVAGELEVELQVALTALFRSIAKARGRKIVFNGPNLPDQSQAGRT